MMDKSKSTINESALTNGVTDVDNSQANNILQVAGIVEDSVVDGWGIRMTLFTQGCPHRCEGCQNPHTHAFEGGESMAVEEVFARFKHNPLLDGMTFSGGEPFCQSIALAELARKLHSVKADVWCYSGYTYEELCNMSKSDRAVKELLNLVDVLVDGRFVINQLDLTLQFRGSSNQRVIDMISTRATGEVTLKEGIR